MSTWLDGRFALVTGAGRGMGRAIAMRLASVGGTVALVARSAGELAETAQGVHGPHPVHQNEKENSHGAAASGR